MAWHRIGYKPSSEPISVSFQSHWVKPLTPGNSWNAINCWLVSTLLLAWCESTILFTFLHKCLCCCHQYQHCPELIQPYHRGITCPPYMEFLHLYIVLILSSPCQPHDASLWLISATYKQKLYWRHIKNSFQICISFTGMHFINIQ